MPVRKSRVVSRTKRVLALVALAAALLTPVGCAERDSATVPKVTGEDPVRAYVLLHKAGLRVSTGGRLNYGLRLRSPAEASVIGGWLPGAGVTEQTPKPGRSVARNSVVVIKADSLRGDRRIFNCDPYPVRVPDLVGQTVGYISEHEGCFSIEAKNLPPLHAASEPCLLDNYVVTKQSPAAGEAIAPLSAGNPPGYATVTVEARVVSN